MIWVKYGGQMSAMVVLGGGGGQLSDEQTSG